MKHESNPLPQTETLVVRRIIGASPERLFEAWTQPKQLLLWWGPQDVECTSAELELKVGGSYRIDNRLPDGQIISIVGEFETIDPPRELAFSWRIENQLPTTNERVSVRFEGSHDETRVTVTHERIQSTAIREDHQRGWDGCLDGLSIYVS